MTAPAGQRGTSQDIGEASPREHIELTAALGRELLQLEVTGLSERGQHDVIRDWMARHPRPASTS